MEIQKFQIKNHKDGVTCGRPKVALVKTIFCKNNIKTICIYKPYSVIS